MATLPSFAAGDLPYTPAPEKTQESSDVILRKSLKGLNLGGFDPDSYADLVSGKSKAAGDAAMAEAEQKRVEAKGKADAQKRYYTGLEQKYQAAEPTLMSVPPKFNVTKDTEQGLMGLAALMTVGSLIIGSKGAASGVNAMNAMTGVLKGYQEGNQQRIDFETKEYEKSIKEWERTLQQTKESLARYEKLASADLNAAISQASAEAAAKGQEVIAAKLRHGGFSEAKDAVDKLIQQTTETNRRMSNSFARVGRPMAVIDKETNSQVFATPSEVAQNPDRYAPIQRQAAGVKEREPGDVTKRIIGKLVPTIQNTENLLEKLNDPAFAAKLDKYRMQSFFREEGGKIASQFLSKNIPDDVKKFIIGVTALRNDYYLDISGKTVTNNEAMRNYNAVPQPGDGSDEFKIKLGILLENYQNLSDGLKQQYPEYMKRFSPAGVPRAKTSEEKFATQADVQETARVRFNGNVEAAKKALRERGFKIEGE